MRLIPFLLVPTCENKPRSNRVAIHSESRVRHRSGRESFHFLVLDCQDSLAYVAYGDSDLAALLDIWDTQSSVNSNTIACSLSRALVIVSN